MRSLFPLILLAGCAAEPVAGDRANATDPAVADAMAGPVMSDKGLSSAAAPDALRPGEQPATLAVPLDARIDTDGAPTLGDVAKARLREAAFAGCDAKIGYSALYSVKLPAAFALPKAARLSEAAGSDKPGCALRIARFALPGDPARVLGDYAALATKAGLVPQRSGSTLSAAKDGLALHVQAVASKDGSRVDLAVRSR